MEKSVLYNKIRCLIQNKKGFSEICKELELNDFELRYLIECMRDYGISVRVQDGKIIKHDKPISIDEPYNIITDKSHIKIGLLGDTHLASITDDVPSLTHVYDIAEDKNVDYMFHCGDLTEGVLGIPDFEKHLKEDTYVGQTRYVIDRYPKYSGKTYMVSGNHDDYWTMLTGGEIIKDISKERSDIVYLGGNRRLVTINGLKIQILHGNFDPITNSWFRCQKYLFSLPIEERPHILHLGHKHTSCYTRIGKTHSVRSGTIMNNPIHKEEAKIKNEKAMYFADISFDDDGLPAEICIEKQSLRK